MSDFVKNIILKIVLFVGVIITSIVNYFLKKKEIDYATKKRKRCFFKRRKKA